MIKDEAWLYGYGLDGENGMYRNLKEIKGTHVEVDQNLDFQIKVIILNQNKLYARNRKYTTQTIPRY